MLREHDGTGRVALGRFWGRRFRRLAPVALAGLALALVVSPVVLERDRLDAAAGDVAAAALHAANWRAAGAELGYGQTMETPSPVSHYWSLAIEEQFYLAFPVLAGLALRRGRRGLAAVLAAAVVLSLAQTLRLDDANRIYLGTDTRAAELAIGGLAAMAWHLRRGRAVGRGFDVTAVVALLAVAALTRTSGLQDAWLYHGGFAAVAALGAVAVLGAVGGRTVGRLGSARPLVWLGLVSYGAYVVHFPLYLLLSAERVGVDGLALLAVRVVASLGLAGLLRVLVEQPVRIGGAFPRWQAPMAFGSGVAVVLVVSVALTQLPSATAPDGLVTASGMTVLTMAPTTAGATNTASASPSVGPADDGDAATTQVVPPASAAEPTGPGPGSGTGASPPPTTTAAPPAPPAPPRLLVVGDSTALRNGEGMQLWAARTGGAVVDVLADNGCVLLFDDELRIRQGWVQPPQERCRPLVDDAVATARDRSSDALVVFINNIQLADWRTAADPVWRSFGDPVFEGRFRAAATEALGRLSAVGVPILLADIPTPAWVPEMNGLVLGVGEPTINDAGRAARYNTVMAEVAAGFPLVRIVPYTSVVAPGGQVPTVDRPDGLHLTLDAVGRAMDGGLDGVLAGSYVDVVDDLALPHDVTRWAGAR